MYCPHCGNKTSDGAKYCSRCGVDIKEYVLQELGEEPEERRPVTKRQVADEFERELLENRLEIYKEQGLLPEDAGIEDLEGFQNLGDEGEEKTSAKERYPGEPVYRIDPVEKNDDGEKEETASPADKDEESSFIRDFPASVRRNTAALSERMEAFVCLVSEKPGYIRLFYVIVTILPLLVHWKRVLDFTGGASPGAYGAGIVLAVLHGAVRILSLKEAAGLSGFLGVETKNSPGLVLTVASLTATIQAILFLISRDLRGFSAAVLTAEVFTDRPVLYFLVLFAASYLLFAGLYRDIADDRRGEVAVFVLAGLMFGSVVFNLVGITLLRPAIAVFAPGLF